jgi:ABC-type polysaccharide/polyol phosphate export permease
MVAIVNTFKYGVLGIAVLDLRGLGMSAVIILAVLASGLWFFTRAEADAADKV